MDPPKNRPTFTCETPPPRSTAFNWHFKGNSLMLLNVCLTDVTRLLRIRSKEMLRFQKNRLFSVVSPHVLPLITPSGVAYWRVKAARGGVGSAHGTHSPPERCWYRQRRPSRGGYGWGPCEEKRSTRIIREKLCVHVKCFYAADVMSEYVVLTFAFYIVLKLGIAA